MSSISGINESWSNHTYTEVESFIKQEMQNLCDEEVLTQAPMSGGFLPNKVYFLDMTSGGELSISLAPGVSGRMSHYHVFIKTGSTPPTITWTGLTESGITTLFNQPTISASKVYELDFVRVSNHIIVYCKEN